MPTTLMALAAGAVAALAASLTLPAAIAQAAVPAVPAPQQSLSVAGYQQFGCLSNGNPTYEEISGTITVPAATDINGTPGISADIYNLGGFPGGVSAGVGVDNSNHQAFYFAYGQWNGQPVTAMSVQPGDKLGVSIDYEGSAQYVVVLYDQTTGQAWSQANPDTNASLGCQTGAYEQSPYPSYDFTTKTTPITFHATTVSWQDQGQPGTSKLLSPPPAGARLFRYTLINTSGATVAVTSKPTDHNNNFTITDK
jgi:hypothetical protein